MVPHKKLGRLPRTYDQRVPHLSSLMAGRLSALAPPPAVVDRMSKLPANWGVMGNDRLGDCTCAALGHAVQLTSFVIGHERTPDDAMVLQLYQQACGWRPDDPSSDRGGNEQSVLSYVHQHGIPLAPGQTDAVAAYIEVDPRNLDDLRRVINEAGFVYAGADIPEAWTQGTDWTAPSPGTRPAGGHAFMIGSYDRDFFYAVSWGEVVRITPAAIQACVVEAYAVALDSWFARSGITVGGLTKAELVEAMQGLAG
jgi:hypothetical protein